MATLSVISRRGLLRRLGLGTVVAWGMPVVTTLGNVAGASCLCDCVTCDWECGGKLCQCGQGCGPLGEANCSADIEGSCFCWENSFCSEIADCVQNADCPPGYACIPNTCCGTPKCLPACGMGPRAHTRHGKLTDGRIR